MNTGVLTYGSQGQGVHLDYSDHKGQKWPWWLCLNGIRVEGHGLGGRSYGRDQAERVSCCQEKAKGQGVTLEEGSVLGLEESGVTQRVQTRLDGDQGELTFSSQQGSEMTSVWRFRQGEIIGVRGGPKAPRLSRVRGNCSWLVR